MVGGMELHRLEQGRSLLWERASGRSWILGFGGVEEEGERKSLTGR